jgi:hypothetical protein
VDTGRAKPFMAAVSVQATKKPQSVGFTRRRYYYDLGPAGGVCGGRGGLCVDGARGARGSDVRDGPCTAARHEARRGDTRRSRRLRSCSGCCETAVTLRGRDVQGARFGSRRLPRGRSPRTFCSWRCTSTTALTGHGTCAADDDTSALLRHEAWPSKYTL